MQEMKITIYYIFFILFPVIHDLHDQKTVLVRASVIFFRLYRG